MDHIIKGVIFDYGGVISYPQNIDYIFFSCDLKMCKPQFAIYKHCIDEMRLEPEECIFIDDTPENLDGAARCGINTLKFENVPVLKSSLNQYLG